MPYGVGVNFGCCVGVTPAMVIRGDLLGAAFGVGMLYWTKLESHAVGFIGGTAPGVLFHCKRKTPTYSRYIRRHVNMSANMPAICHY